MGHYLLFQVTSRPCAMEIDAISLVTLSFEPKKALNPKNGLLGMVKIDQKLKPIITPAYKLNLPFKEIELEDRIIFSQEGGILVSKLIDVVDCNNLKEIPPEISLPFCRHALEYNQTTYSIFDPSLLFQEVLQ